MRADKVCIKIKHRGEKARSADLEMVVDGYDLIRSLKNCLDTGKDEATAITNATNRLINDSAYLELSTR